MQEPTHCDVREPNVRNIVSQVSFVEARRKLREDRVIDKTVGDARTNQLNGRDTALAKPTQN